MYVMTSSSELRAWLLVSLFLAASNTLVAGQGIIEVDEDVLAANSSNLQTSTFGLFYKPFYHYWLPSYCAWDYGTTGVWEIVYTGGDCTNYQVTPCWERARQAARLEGLPPTTKLQTPAYDLHAYVVLDAVLFNL
jgi:hypothetical protein